MCGSLATGLQENNQWKTIFKLRQMKWNSLLKLMSDSLRPHELYSPWNSPGQNTGVGGLFLLQGIFPTQGSNPGLLHCRRILYQLSHQGSLRILKQVSYPFSRGSSQPRNWTRLFWMAGGFFTNWAIREAHGILHSTKKKWAIKTWTMMKTEMHITQWKTHLKRLDFKSMTFWKRQN